MAVVLGCTLVAEPAQAQAADACGAVASDGSVRCTGAGTGIDVETGGDVAIHVGDVRTRGDGALGVRAQAGGDIDFRAGRVVTEGSNASGVQLTTTSDHGTILASVDAVRTAGERSFGINLAGGQLLDAAVTASSIVTTGERSSGIRIARNNGGEANLDIEAGSITTFGTVADGITLITDNVGQATIRAGRLEVSGLEAGGIYASAEAMDLDLTIGSALASGVGSAGVVATGANVVLHSTGTIASTGENGRGIAIVTGRDADLTIDGDVTATGVRSTAIAVATNAADGVATVNMTGDIVTSGYFTTGFSAGGEGRVVANLNNVTNNGGPLSAYAILATPAGDAEVTVHNVTVRGFAFNSTYVRSREGDVSLAVTGLYETEMAGGIYVDAWGEARLSVNDMTLKGYDVSAIVMAGGDVDLAIRGTIDDHVETAIGNAGSAIQLVAGGGSGTGFGAVENDGTVNTFADTRSALSIVAQDTAMLTGTGSIHTRGGFATGVTMRADTGGIVLEQRDIVTEGDGSSGAMVTAAGDAIVALDRVATQGWSASGIDIRAGGQVAADIGAIETKGAQSGGLRISTLGGIDAAIGSISTAGNRSTALQLAAEGDADVGVEGQLATAGNQAFGILAVTAGDLSIAAADITTQGRLSRGVFADVGGDALLRHGSISTSGAGADGINLVAEGAVDIELDTVATTGEAADGIDVQAGGAVRALVGSASASGADARAIHVTGRGPVTLVAQGGDVWAASDAILLSSGEGSVLANHGSISADSGAAIRVSGGGATIWNGGAVIGGIVLTDAADLVTNSGTMRLTGAQLGAGDDRLVNHGVLALAGDLDFGDGNDTLANDGTLSLAGAATAGNGLRVRALGPVTRSIAGLNDFANNGLIDLRSGVAGDVLDISGGFSGSGDGLVALDVRFGGTPVVDRLDIGGAATGSTRIVIHPLDAPTALHAGTVVVRAGAGTRADAFRLDAPAPGGFFASGLAFDAATTSFRLVTTPSASAYRLLKLGEGARSAWLESSDMVAAHLDSGQGRGFWFTAGGNVAKRDQTRRFEGFGFAQNVALGYAQDSFSTQFGYGIGSGAVTLGVTAGYGNSTLAFVDSADRAEYDALNAGLYAALRSGSFYANALAKYDHYDIGVSFQSIGEKAATGGSVVGARIEAGLRFGSARFHAEPRVSLSYQHMAIDPLALSAAIRFHDWDNGRATAGLRVASIHPLGAAELRIYAEADYVKALGAGAGLVFATGVVALGAEDGRFPSHGVGKLGFEVSSGRTSGFVEALGRYGGHHRGGGARAGLRIAF